MRDSIVQIGKMGSKGPMATGEEVVYELIEAMEMMEEKGEKIRTDLNISRRSFYQNVLSIIDLDKKLESFPSLEDFTTTLKMKQQNLSNFPEAFFKVFSNSKHYIYQLEILYKKNYQNTIKHQINL